MVLRETFWEELGYLEHEVDESSVDGRGTLLCKEKVREDEQDDCAHY